MTPAELITTYTRRWLNDETVSTYKWTQAELVDYYNAVLDDISRETEYFLDGYTAASVEITTAAGTPDYAYSALATDIKSVHLSGTSAPLDFSSVQELENKDSTWRYLSSIYGTDISFVDGGASADTIVSTTVHFVEDGNISADDWIVITGSTSNNYTVQVHSVTDHLITLETTASLTTEVAGDPVLIKVLYCDTPTDYTLGYRTGYITLYPCPDEAGKLFLDLARYQITELTVATLGSYTIPIDSHYHQGLVDGVCMYAYLKSGPSTFNIEKSKIHEGRFYGSKQRIKKDLINLRSPRQPIQPSNGAI